MNARGIIAEAGNIKGGKNPPFDVQVFLEMYPQFKPNNVPSAVLGMYVDNANANILESRWAADWLVGISLYLAHHLTLYMMAKSDPELGMDAAVASAQPSGLVASKSVAGVSVSIDYSNAMNDLNGWAAYKQTTYGIQFATMAQEIGMGMMVVR